MNNPLDPTLRELNDCGCCAGTAVETPVAIDNRPGLDAISFRAGKQPQFKATMLASLSSANYPALRSLKTREDDDFTIALLDGCATIADVLTFYSERIANESYLRTATERSSVLELARSIGYELNPGVAASTYLVFSVDTAAGAPGYANIDAGTKVQSIPGPGEKAQVFETLEDLYSDKAWNSMAVKSTEFVTPYLGMTQIYLKGTTTNLKPGDVLLVIGDERLSYWGSENWDIRRVKEIATFPNSDEEKAYTLVTLDHGLGTESPRVDPAKKNPRVYALRQRAALFGANAADWNLLPKDVRAKFGDDSDKRKRWPEFTISDVSGSNYDTIHLDAVYSGIVVDSWIVLSLPTYEEVYQVTAVTEDSPAKFGLTNKSTKLTIQGEHLVFFDDKIRKTVVFGESEELAWAETPITDKVSGKEIVLDGVPETDLPDGRTLMVQSESESLIEVVTLKTTEAADADHTKLILETELINSYDPTTTVVYANVAYATEGATTKDEIIGSGDATQANQSFELSKTPLTYIPAATPSGGESTLKITVNDVEWTEVSSLYDHGPEEHIYVTRLADDGTVTAVFGDGESGARLPTGQNNVKATYRTGTGIDGLLQAEQLSLLITRPLGVKSVINPEATQGAADPQELADARENAPTTVLTLDRVVSQLDYEDFARNFSGIAKALATWTWNEHSRGIYLTVAGEQGSDLTGSSTISSLRDSLLEFGNPLVPIQIASYQKVKFELAGTVYAAADRDPKDVGTAVNDALKEAFSFDARSFGQPVTLSEVEAVIQNVVGVSYIDLDALYVGSTTMLETYLASEAPRDGAAFELVSPAQLLTLDEASLSGLRVQTV